MKTIILNKYFNIVNEDFFGKFFSRKDKKKIPENLNYAEKLRYIMIDSGFEFIKDFKKRYELKQMRPKDLDERFKIEDEPSGGDGVIPVNPDFYKDRIKNRRYIGMDYLKNDSNAIMHHFTDKNGSLEVYDDGVDMEQ